MYKKFFVTIAAAMAATVSAHAAPLTSQQLSATNDAGAISPNPATIGAGVDFIAQFHGSDFFSIDFTEDGFVTVQWIQPGSLGHGATQNLSFSDVNLTIAEFVAFNLISTSGVTGIDQSDLGFTADSISMSLGSGSSWDHGGSFTAQILFGGREVPLPASLPLFLAGLGALGWVRRKRAAAR